MTTIAYKDGEIAYDSRTTCGDTIMDDDANKKIESRGVKFFLCGSTCDFEYLIEAYFGTPSPTPIEASGYALVGQELWYIGHNQDGFWKVKLRKDICHAIGSGSGFALGAMDAGLNARRAVAIAIGRDTGSGGRVRVHFIYDDDKVDGLRE